MKNLPSLLLSAFCGLILGIAAFWFLQPKNVDVKELIKQANKESEARVDSLTTILNIGLARSSAFEDSLRQQKIKTAELWTLVVYQNARHDKISSVPIRMLTDSARLTELDSLYPGYNRYKAIR